MSLNINIITEDSNAKLPSINAWKATFGKGIIIDDEVEIKSILKLNGFNIPSNDIENEESYVLILKKYLRPAKNMFSGNYGEVRDFGESLKTYGNVKIYTLTGRYGLIPEDKDILPYSFHLNSEKKLFELDQKTNFSDKIKEIYSNSDIFLIILPSYILNYVVKKNIFDSNIKNLKIAVCSSKMEELMVENNFQVFIRSGVARLGKVNRDKIINLIKNYKKKN